MNRASKPSGRNGISARQTVVCILAALLLATSAASQTPLRISFGNAPPLEFQDEHGQPQGFTIDVIGEAAKRAGIPIIWKPGGAIPDNNKALRSGDLDMISAASASDERRRDFYVSDSWWWAEMLAIAPAASPVHSEADFKGKRLAVAGATSGAVADRYPGNTLLTGPNARWTVAQVCAGQADAAVFENMYLRELFLGLDRNCREMSLRVFDVDARREYHIIARRAAEKRASAIRRQIDAMTVDGTLAAIAARRIPVSTPQATRIAELLRASHEQQLSNWRIAALACLLAIFSGFLAWQHHSRVWMRGMNERLVVARKELESAIAQLETALDSLDDAVLIFSLDGTIVYRNHAARRAFDAERTAADLWRRLRPVWAEGGADAAPVDQYQRILSGARLRAEEFHLEAGDATLIFECNASLVRDKADRPLLAVAVLKDVTVARRAEQERERLRSEFAQAQKMESVGRLAGGVAHDFNNLLTVINGYASLLSRNPLLPRSGADYLRAIRTAGETAAQLTGQLLAFSRKQPVKPEVLDLNHQTSELAVMLRRIIREDIAIVTVLAGEPQFILGDRTQLHQLVMNLAVNARDAMPRGGTLSIEIAPDDEPSGGVSMTVRDTGAGMSQDVLNHLFEPFFTTKESGVGTGLGLATVYAIVKQWNGHISVSSEPGVGSTFRIVIPRAAPPSLQLEERRPNGSAVGNETILLVEDQEQVRRLARHILEDHKYKLLEASGGEEALAVAAGFPGRIDLLLTDVVMPGMSGRDLAVRLRSARPITQVLFMSGYTDDVLGREDMLEPGVELIGKPFTPEALVERVRSVLDRNSKTNPTFTQLQS